MGRANRLLVTFLSTASMLGPARAEAQLQTQYQPAVNNCQAASLDFEAALRKRPLAIANESNNTAFLSCAFSIESIAGVTTVYVMFRNLSKSPGTVSCTLADEITPSEGHAIYIPKSRVLQPGGLSASISWLPSEHEQGGLTFGAPAISCAVPAGFEINGTRLFYVNEGA